MVIRKLLLPATAGFPQPACANTWWVVGGSSISTEPADLGIALLCLILCLSGGMPINLTDLPYGDGGNLETG